MSNLITNPYGQAKKPIPVLKRKGGSSTAVLAAGDITKPELKKYLEATKKGESPEAELETKFNDYISNGVSGGYLDDADLRTLFTDYVKKQITDGSAEGLKKTVGSDSILGDYVDRKRFKHDSLEAQLFEYIQVALEKKAEGKDPKSEPISLTHDDRLEGFVDHLTDKDKGLTFRNSNLEQLRTSNDPIMRLMHSVARDLGLDVAIESTRTQLLSGKSSELTKKLSDRLPELLKKEEERLNEILTPEGELIISKRADGKDVKIPALEMDSDIKEILAGGKDAELENSVFADDDRLDFREFFTTAQKLAIQGEAEDLNKHVADGLSFILAHHKAKLKLANGDKELEKEAQENFKLISNAILGKSLLPSRLAKIIRESANVALGSKDFQERASAGDIESLSVKLREDFVKELSGNSEIRNLDGITNLMGADEKVEIINPKTFEISTAEIGYVETNEINGKIDPDAVSGNKDLSADKLSLERVVQAYDRTVETASDKVFSTIANTVTQNTNIVPKKKIEEAAHKTEEALNDAENAINSTDRVFEVLEEQIGLYNGKGGNPNVVAGSVDDITDSLRKFVEESLNMKGSEKKGLWSQKKEGVSESTQLAKTIGTLASRIKKGDSKSINTALKSLKSQMIEKSGKSDDGGSEVLEGRLTDNKGISRLRDLLSNLRVKAEDTEALSKTLDLDKMMQIFDGTEGKSLQRALETLAYTGTKFSDVKDKPDSDRFGEFVSLLFAKDGKGGIDEAKRLSALTILVKETAGTDQSELASLTTHIVNKLKGSAVKKNEETSIAIRLKQALSNDIEIDVPDDSKAQSKQATQDATEAQTKAQAKYSAAVKTAKEATNAYNAAKGNAKKNAKTAMIKAEAAKARAKTALDKAKAKTAKAQEAEAQAAKQPDTTKKVNIDIKDFIKKNVLEAQQRKTVLQSAYGNMVRQLDQIRGHFTAVGIRSFGDAETFNKVMKPAADTVISALDTADKDAPDAINKVQEALANDAHASNLFNQYHNGIKTDRLKAPEYQTEHPGDILDRVLSFLQSTLYSPVLNLFGIDTASSTEAKETVNA